MSRCPSINPKSTRHDQCERPAGHAGDHQGVSHSGALKIYPSKWTDEDAASDGSVGSVHTDAPTKETTT